MVVVSAVIVSIVVAPRSYGCTPRILSITFRNISEVIYSWEHVGGRMVCRVVGVVVRKLAASKLGREMAERVGEKLNQFDAINSNFLIYYYYL